MSRISEYEYSYIHKISELEEENKLLRYEIAMLKNPNDPGNECIKRGHDKTDIDKGGFGLQDNYYYTCRRCKKVILED
jgi:hypothetical protein